MHYKVVFDVTQTAYHQWSELAGAIVFLLAGSATFFCRRKLDVLASKMRGRMRFGAFGAMWFVFGLIFFISFYLRYSNYTELRTAVAQSRCKVAEGVVTGCHRLPTWSHARGIGEAIFVNGLRFSYREGSAQNGFHKAGVVTNGMHVRISYCGRDDSPGKDIAKLEVGE